MTQTTTLVGRAKLAHPDLGFDTDDAGVALHAAINTMWTSVSNNLASRWTGSIILANGASTSITHNFTLAIAKLKILMFESGVQLTETEIAARYSITQTTTDIIAVQNISGVQRTFEVLILPYRYSITNDDLDASVSGYWDTVNGSTWNKSLYKNGNYTVSAPQEFENMIVLGNLTLNANLIVRGRLVVIGDIVGVGYKFDCDGDVFVTGTVSITGISGPSMTIGGHLCVYSSNSTPFIMSSNSASQGTLTVKKDVIILDPATGVSKYLKTSGTNCAGNNIVIFGSALCGIDCAGNGSITDIGQNAGSLKIGGNLICGEINPAVKAFGSNATGAGNTNGGNGGAITINGTVMSVYDVQGYGGASIGTGTAGNGGNITIHGGGCCGLISVYGALAATGIGGIGGTVVINNSILNSGINTNGGSTSSTTLDAGSPGNITVKGSVYGPINASAGSGGPTKKDGSTILVKEFAGELTANGGNINGGNGGNLTITGNSFRDNIGDGVKLITMNGGSRDVAAVSLNAGNGGIVICNGNFGHVVSLNGGSIINGANGGNGGSLTVYGHILTYFYGVIDGHTLKGGATGAATAVKAGSGGFFLCNGNAFGYCAIDVSAGNNTFVNNAAGANAGGMYVKGILQVGRLTCRGGDTIGSGTGGNSGILEAEELHCQSIDYVFKGGNVNGTGTGGSCNQIYIKNKAVIDGGTFTFSGGDSNGGNGGHNDSSIVIGGDLIINTAANLYVRGGDSSAASGTVSGGRFYGNIRVGGDLLLTSGGKLEIRGGDATNVGLTSGSGGSLKFTSDYTLIVIGNIQFGNIRNPSGTMIVRGGDGRHGAGNGGYISCHGRWNCYGTLDVRGGSSTIGNSCGKLTSLSMHGGGYFNYIVADPIGSASAYSANWAIGGHVTIALLNIAQSKYPLGQHSVFCTIHGGVAMVCINQRQNANSTFCDPANGNNLFPQAATGTAGGAPGGPMFGYDIAGTTIWKWRSFANA